MYYLRTFCIIVLIVNQLYAIICYVYETYGLVATSMQYIILKLCDLGKTTVNLMKYVF